ncbi:amastin [Trypanosoma cruzi cruzi]|uniref:Putative amastin n=2 Tax=Trypanosoma cruzi TaxID=5693 RepID=A0A2V2UJ10_TRYCR|nr:amastin [Trypanosoma cruzi cruzi]PBJ70060.1 amastin [Trypanosoma cruzi cruzi]PWU83949.1 putative amastin [Trypanosoma cruzi]PWU83951.1 putative amastin [Trypanosoma cruzi]
MSKLGAILYGAVGFLAFLFVLVGTPIDQFRVRGKKATGNTPCITLWGIKEDCHNTKYELTIGEVFRACPSVLRLFRMAEAFSIISILLLLAATALGVAAHFYLKTLKIFATLLLVVSIVTVGLVWIPMAYFYNRGVDNCFEGPLKKILKYGGGFVIIVIGWCLIFVAVVLLRML